MSKLPKSEIIAFKADKQLKKDLDELSEAADVPVSQIIRIALRSYVKQIKK